MQHILSVRKTLIASALLLGGAGLANAASESFNVTVTTLPDLVLTQVQALSFGTNVYIDAGGVCTMDADIPGDTATQTKRAVAVTATGFGDLTGAGCVNGVGAGTPGLYKIAGLQGQSVSISIGGVVGTDFSFTPAGCIATYDDGVDGDLCTTYSGAISAQSYDLASTTDGGDAGVTAGELIFSVGGSITIGASDLTANLAYSESFPVDVVY